MLLLKPPETEEKKPVKKTPHFGDVHWDNLPLTRSLSTQVVTATVRYIHTRFCTPNTYPPVNKHSNGKSPSWIGNTSSNGGFSIAMLHVRLPECTKKKTFHCFTSKVLITGKLYSYTCSWGFPASLVKAALARNLAMPGGSRRGGSKPKKNPWISWQGWKILGSYPMILQEKFREIYKFSPWETVMVLKTELVQYHKLFHPTCLCKGTRNSGYMFLSLPLTWLFFHSKSNPLRSKCPQRTNKMAVP